MCRMRPQLSQVMTFVAGEQQVGPLGGQRHVAPFAEVLLPSGMDLDHAGHDLALVALGDPVEEVEGLAVQNLAGLLALPLEGGQPVGERALRLRELVLDI